MSTPKDLSVHGKQQTINPATISGDGDYTEGAAVDGLNCEAVEHILNVGESGDTWGAALKTDVILQHSEDNVTWEAVDDASHYIGTMITEASGIFAVFDAEAEDNNYASIVYCGPYRYSRIYLDRTGNHASGTPMSAMAIKKLRMTGSLAPVS